MMTAVPFDTLAYAKKLEARGVDSKQAEAHAEVLAEVLETSFQTKKESEISVNNLSQEIHSLRQEMNSLRQEMNSKIEIVTSKIESVRSDLKAEILTIKSEVIKWVFGISFAQAALILSVLKFFH